MQYFLDEKIAGTPVIEHMIEGWNMRHHPNICFLFYEDMKHDLRSQIRKVAGFLGKQYSEEQMVKLAEHLHFDNFKNNPYVNREDLREAGYAHMDRGVFCRKGKAGSWKECFTPEMNEKFDKWLAEKLKGTDLRFTMDLEKQD